jgi:hypothetical protein
VPAIERRELAHGRVNPSQGQHRREGPVVRGAELHDPRNAWGGLATQRDSRHDAPHAVADQEHLTTGGLTLDALVQIAGQVADASPPVVRVMTRVEARDAQRQLELEAVEPHGAERDEPLAARQSESRQVTGGDLEQVHPQHVV